MEVWAEKHAPSRRLTARRTDRAFLKSLLLRLKTHDPATYDHSLRTLRLSLLLGREFGLSAAKLRALKLGALLHDVGKIYVPVVLLRKPAALTREEWATMQRHPRDGQRLLCASPSLAAAARATLEHHERWDGGGYPQGLRGDAIGLEARVLAVADAFDVMANERPYRRAMSYDAALAELIRCAGTQFDPHIVATFGRMSRDRVEKVMHGAPSPAGARSR
ncbi:MAG: HD-GYP domain-containing protein [Acidobacteria bacterium]|nr:HD-GYP domain-containing protein [Acidobacteriota bacterium]